MFGVVTDRMGKEEVLRGAVVWLVTIISIQGHRLERLLVEPAARAWMEEHVTRGSEHRMACAECAGRVVDVFEFEESQPWWYS